MRTILVTFATVAMLAASSTATADCSSDCRNSYGRDASGYKTCVNACRAREAAAAAAKKAAEAAKKAAAEAQKRAKDAANGWKKGKS